MGGDDVVAPALLVEANERAGRLGVVVGHAHGDCGAHAREAVDEDPEERAVAESRKRCNVDAVEESPGLCGGEHRSLAGLDDVLGSAHGARGVEVQHLADDEPVEEHAKGREVLFDTRGGQGAGELLDVGRDHHGLHLIEYQTALFAPGGEAPDGGEVGEPGIGVSDMGGEELPEAALGAGRRGRRAPAWRRTPVSRGRRRDHP